MAKTAKTYFVRIKPYNKKKGFLVRNFMFKGVRFTSRWKEISSLVANELQHLVQPHDPDAEIPLFDVKTKEEAVAIEEKERDTLDPKSVARVKDAERIPDKKFRDDKPKIDEDSGKITDDHVEKADAGDVVAPAPSIRQARAPKEDKADERVKSRT